MWRFKSSTDAVSPGIPFHLLGGKESMPLPPSPELGTSKAYINSGEGFGNHMWF